MIECPSHLISKMGSIKGPPHWVGGELIFVKHLEQSSTLMHYGSISGDADGGDSSRVT